MTNPDDPTSGNSDLDATLEFSAGAAPVTATPRELRSIGPYQLVRKLGEGGMGQVWLAEQTAPVNRTVALKLIRVGQFDDEVLRRFQAERQSLAMMDHPAIAKVFDAGSTSDGQPYFVMEYVQGVPITQYCDSKRLSINERLALFIKVCEGVQHAHQKAIIHRDLKPANILVTEVDRAPVPRIIDFGIAKAVSQRVESLILDLLEWIAKQDRSYEDTMDVWRTSCPKLPVWEDATDRGLIELDGNNIVRLTRAGCAFLKEHRLSK